MKGTFFKPISTFLPCKLACMSTFWQPIGKLKKKNHWKLCILQKRDLYLNQFSKKNGLLVNLRGRKSTLSGPHIPVPTFPLSTPRAWNNPFPLTHAIITNFPWMLYYKSHLSTWRRFNGYFRMCVVLPNTNSILSIMLLCLAISWFNKS